MAEDGELTTEVLQGVLEQVRARCSLSLDDVGALAQEDDM